MPEWFPRRASRSRARTCARVEIGVRRHRAVEVQTDERGRYRFWSARAGSIRVAAPGCAPRAIFEHEGQQSVLLPEAAISGVVVGLDGRPVTNARVAAVERGFATPPWGWPDHAVRTDAEGRFTIAQLLPDEHELAALEPDGTHAGTQRVHVGISERREHVIITLDTPVFRYRAQVVEAESKAPVPGCYAEWKSADATFGASSWTDEHGNIDLPLASVGAADGPITPSEWTLSPVGYHVAITDAQGRADLMYVPERFSVLAVRPGLFAAQVLDAEPATQEIELRMRPVD